MVFLFLFPIVGAVIGLLLFSIFSIINNKKQQNMLTQISHKLSDSPVSKEAILAMIAQQYASQQSSYKMFCMAIGFILGIVFILAIFMYYYIALA